VQPVALSRRVPLLENMGFRVISERTFEIGEKGDSQIFIHDMELENAYGQPIDLSDGGLLFEEVFLSVWTGDADNDGYNALAQTAGLGSNEIVILRAYGRYLQQAGIPQSQSLAIKLDSAARAAAVARNLRLWLRGRRRASALRQGGPRRPALVGPAAGLPHRGARPGQGAAGQERRHRAGRRQGRLLSPSACRSAAAATTSSRPAPRPTRPYPHLLSITDNLDGDKVVPPPMAAAATSTIPISSLPPTRAPRPSPTRPTASAQEAGFWLDDAFASGGSAGYDHKKMGITARGAWEAVKRHFREMNRHPDDAVQRRRRRRHVGRRVRQRHAAVGKIRLIAAFDHRDIFIDPDPDMAKNRLPSASACSTCRAPAGRTTTSRSCRPAA
jgi:hypothetical protein